MSTDAPVRPPDEETVATPRPPRRDRGGPVGLGLVLVAAGTMWLWAALGIDVPVAVVTPVVLVLLGVVVVVSALRGTDHAVVGVVVFLGVVLAAGAVLSATTGVVLRGAVGERDTAPTTVTALDDASALFAGRQRLDLRDLDLPEGTTAVDVSTVLGEVEVLVPEGMAVRVDAGVGVGSLRLFGELVEGVGLRDEATTPGWETAGERLDLRLRAGLGEVRVATG